MRSFSCIGLARRGLIACAFFPQLGCVSSVIALAKLYSINYCGSIGPDLWSSSMRDPHCQRGRSPVLYAIRINTIVLITSGKIKVNATSLAGDASSTVKDAEITTTMYTAVISQPCQDAGYQPQPNNLRLNQYFCICALYLNAALSAKKRRAGNRSQPVYAHARTQNGVRCCTRTSAPRTTPDSATGPRGIRPAEPVVPVGSDTAPLRPRT